MGTLAEKLCELSGLPSGTATVEEHLCAITAGAGAGVSETLIGFVVDGAGEAGVISDDESVIGTYSDDAVLGTVDDSDSVIGAVSDDDSLFGVLTCEVDVPYDGALPGVLRLRYDADDVTGVSDGADLATWPQTADPNSDWDLVDYGVVSTKYEATTGPDGGPAIRSESEALMQTLDVGPAEAVDRPLLVALVWQPLDWTGFATQTVVHGVDGNNTLTLTDASSGTFTVNNGLAGLGLSVPSTLGDWKWVILATGLASDPPDIMLHNRGDTRYSDYGDEGIEGFRLGGQNGTTSRFNGRYKLLYVWEAGTATVDEIRDYLAFRFSGIVTNEVP